MKEFKIRASACGQIMTNPRSKNETLSQTTKTYCETWLKEQLYSRRKEFSSKYTDKGNIMEDESLDFIAQQLNYGMLIKNEQFFENDFFTGTPDVILKNHLIDVKNSWDNFTFPLFETKVDKNYYYQAQVYMALTGRDSYKLIYVLSDTPEHLIVSEVRSYVYRNGIDEVDAEIYEKFKAKMTYSDIPNEYKIKVFEIEKDEEVIKAIEQRVLECRTYVEDLKLTLNN